MFSVLCILDTLYLYVEYKHRYRKCSKYASLKKILFSNDAQIENWSQKVSIIWCKITTWRNIRAWRLNGERWNNPVRMRKQESTHSTSRPPCSKSLRCRGSVVWAFIAPPTISKKKKKRSPVENASYYGMCLRGCHENSLCLAHQWRHRLTWASRSVGI